MKFGKRDLGFHVQARKTEEDEGEDEVPETRDIEVRQDGVEESPAPAPHTVQSHDKPVTLDKP